MTCFTTSLFKMMALSDSLVAYTAYCDQLSELGPLVERVANKHVSLGVQPEHYPVVGVTLLGALEVLIHLYLARVLKTLSCLFRYHH